MTENPTDSNGQEVFQAQYIPKQKGPPSSDHPSMKTYISTYPALGQVTLIEKTTTVFTALLEVEEARAADLWQISLWHSEGRREWQEVPMQPLKDVIAFPIALQNGDIVSGRKRLYFTTPLAIHLPTSFTLKFRAGEDDSWKWVNHHQGTTDGTIILNDLTPQDAISSNLGDYIQDLNPDLKVTNSRTQSPGTTLWSVEAVVDGVDGVDSKFQNINIGLPWGRGGFSRWFALVRIWTPWLAPRQGKTSFSLDKEAVMCSFLSLKGKHLVMLAISGVEDLTNVFINDNLGNVVLRMRNDRTTKGTAHVLVGLGDDFESANAAVMYRARDFVAATQVASGEQAKEYEALGAGDLPTKAWEENWYDGLTYCTWNALGQRLTEEKILNAVRILMENKINITNFIIDDNWQSIDYRGNGQFQHGWIEFEAERKAFPDGLKNTIRLIRETHPSIQHVAVWHAILGYWGGISPDGKLANSYKTDQVVREDALRRNLPLGGLMTVVGKEDVGRFYDDFYRFLSSCGVDAVKTDAQFMLDLFVSAESRRDLIPAYLDAWTISTLRYFGPKAISCMSQTPQILFHAQMPGNRPPYLVRNSDDFFPEIPTSHPWHIFVNAHNTLFTQHLNLVPDWDMFQTVHDYSGFHAAARCVSGGPIYITDVPGYHDLDLINQMTGPTVQGKTVIFRPSVVGKSLNPYNGYDDDNLLLIGTYHGRSTTGTGMIGVFNVSQRPLTELIHLSKFPGVIDSGYYIVRAHTSAAISPILQSSNPSALFKISLGIRGYEILSAYQLNWFKGGVDNRTWVANLGLLRKMAAPCAIAGNTITQLASGRILVDTNLKALGVLGIYISTLPKIDFKKDTLATIQGKVIPVEAVSLSEVNARVLEIDVEKAWKEMGLEPGWSNEVEVKFFINKY